MSGKYAFTQTLREVRFHLCQTSEGSAAVRYVESINLLQRLSISWPPMFPEEANHPQIFPHARIPNYEEEQPKHSNLNTRSAQHRAKNLGKIRSVESYSERNGMALTYSSEFGKEKVESLKGIGCAFNC